MKDEVGKLKLPFGEIPLPKWAAYALSAIAVVATAFWAWNRFIEPSIHSDHAWVEKARAWEMQEAMKHIGDTPDSWPAVFDGEWGKLEAGVYSADGCSVVKWTLRDGKPLVKITPHPSRDIDADLNQPKSPLMLSGIFGKKEDNCPPECLASGDVEDHGDPTWQCIDEDARRDCLVPVYIGWDDGCSFLYLYDSCRGYFSEERYKYCGVH